MRFRPKCSPERYRKIIASARLGGKARALILEPERRREIGRLAAKARWDRVKIAEASMGYPRPTPELPPENGPKDPLLV